MLRDLNDIYWYMTKNILTTKILLFLLIAFFLFVGSATDINAADKEFIIIQSFQAMLDRDPTNTEVIYWTSKSDDVLGAVDESGYPGVRRVINGTVQHQVSDRVSAISNIYLRALKRNSRSDELEFHINYVSPTNLIRKQLFDSTERTSAITDAYVNILGRQPAQSDLDFYTTTRSNISDITTVLLASTERTSMTNNLFQQVLGRDATSEETSRFNSQKPSREGAQWNYYYRHDIWLYAVSLLEGEEPASLIQPADLVYKGAFRLPAGGGTDQRSWDWGGSALAYYPDGDSGGANDGYPGSLFGTGHEQYQYISEISIPVPVISGSKNLSELNTAATLQDFQDIRAGLFGELELPRVGLEYLFQQGDQTTGKLYFTRGQHLQDGETGTSHGWFELDLTNPQRQGPWSIEGREKYVTTDYLFAAPTSWADTYIGSRYLITGRYRDGGQGAQGPSMFAIAPWQAGNPPAANSSLANTALLLYPSYYDDPSANNAMDNYHHSDQWAGGAWLTKDNRSAVVFTGIKGQGDCWYGYYDGTVWPEEPPYPPEGPGERGWWSSSFVGQIIFYDPDDLAAVAQGSMETHEPQPYATLNIDDVLYYQPTTELRYLGGVTFDRERGLLYIFEIRGDQETQRPLGHVWEVQ